MLRPTTKTDGKYRRIDVKPSHGDYKLSYRRGYYADKPQSGQAEAAADDPLIPLLGFGMPNFDQITYKTLPRPFIRNLRPMHLAPVSTRK